MPTRTKKPRQLTDKEKLARDLKLMITLRALHKEARALAQQGLDAEAAEKYAEWQAELKRQVMTKRQLSPADLEARNAAWLAMGEPEYSAPAWKAKLSELQSSSQRRRGNQQPVPPQNTDPDDRNSLYWRYMLLTAQQAWAQRQGGKPIDLVEVPGQRHYRQTKEEQAEARRMYRWLWRNFPGLLKACDSTLRALIRSAGGVA